MWNRTMIQRIAEKIDVVYRGEVKSVQRSGIFLVVMFFLLSGCLGAGGVWAAGVEPGPGSLPNLGQRITPLAPEGSRFFPLNPDLPGKPDWLAGQAVTSVVSPDGRTMLVLTSGYNRVFDRVTGMVDIAESNEYVFVYDISTPTLRKTQVLRVANTFPGRVASSPARRASQFRLTARPWWSRITTTTRSRCFMEAWAAGRPERKWTFAPERRGWGRGRASPVANTPSGW